MKQHQQGSTLIELMIVIAIIGIVASIALPVLRDYVIRAKVTGALVEASKVETDLALFYATNGRFPINADERASFAILPADNDPNIRRLTVAGVGACNASAGCAKVQIQVMLQRAVYFGIDGDAHSQFVLVGSASEGSISWECGPRDVQPLKPGWLPSTCRTPIP